MEPEVRRRTNSVTRVTEIKDCEKKQRKSQPDHPIHKPTDSLLSSDSGYTNYRGLFNLCFIILVVSNTRVALENIIKYGILVDPIQWVIVFFNRPNLAPIFYLIIIANLFICVSLGIEKLLTDRRYSDRTAVLLASANVLTLLSVPPFVFSSGRYNPIGASICCLLYSIFFLKLISYHMVNYWCRQKLFRLRSNPRSSNDLTNGHSDCSPPPLLLSPVVAYPNNINFSDLYYFIFAPTLCYELNFPRSQRIRKRFLIKRTLECMFLFHLNLGLIQQWMVPTITNSLMPFIEMSGGRMLERLLKLAVPNILIWLVFFYFYFHSLLNVIAELLRFADREFYRDWWNSESVEYFWQNWNIPVHRWCVRHLYIPLLSQTKVKINRFQASMVVFILSAFFHEYMVSVPLNMYRIWAFTGMLMQLPFSFIVRKFFNRQYANVAVWISLIIGQPLCILMYYHDYYVIHNVKY